MKSDLLKCIIQPQQPESPSLFDCKIFDDAVLVHGVTGADTFDDYAENVSYLTLAVRAAKELMWYGMHTFPTV